MNTSELVYHLPLERIAQRSVHPRDAARLLSYAAAADKSTDLFVRDLPRLLQRGDLLVFNNSKVFRARLRGTSASGGKVEVFLLRPCAAAWRCLGRPGKRLTVGAEIKFTSRVTGRVSAHLADGEFLCQLLRGKKILSPAEVMSFADKHGDIPLPPYVTTGPKKLSAYQTVYASERGSVAAPTAGFHFTRSLLSTIKKLGVETATITLHVGLGTFRPIKSAIVEEHMMHNEWVVVPQITQQKIAQAKKAGRRVIAVGTTTTRALEGWVSSKPQRGDWTGDINIFILPGYKFRVIDGLLTNFHLPKSTLLLLVGAFIEFKSALRGGGVRRLKKLYTAALARRYRFFSFGDAMFIH